MPELAADLAAVSEALFIDADSTVEPGVWTVNEILAGTAESGTHSFTPMGLLTLAQALYGQAPRARMIRIGAACFDHGEEITPAVARTIDEVVAYVRDGTATSR
jgi:Ni,Fe-hydrogenase maturation factor